MIELLIMLVGIVLGGLFQEWKYWLKSKDAPPAPAPAMPVMVREILPVPLTDYDPAKFTDDDMAHGSTLVAVSDSLAGRIRFKDGHEEWVFRAGGRIWMHDADKIRNMKDYR